MDYVQSLRQKAGHQPLILPGAVVIIVNQQDEVLLQLRKDGSWGLPGGLMELGESLEETAVREVKEETGFVISELKLLGVFSGKEYFLQVENGDQLYSVTAVYTTKKAAGQLYIDNLESDDVRYFPFAKLPENMDRSYRSYLAAY